MTPIVSAYRRPNGLMITVQVLGGIDLGLSLISVISAAIGLIIMSLITRRQPRPDQVRQAEVFG